MGREERERLATLIEEIQRYVPPLPRETTPVENPATLFAHLPEETRKWLSALREEDISEMREAVKFLRDARTVGRFGRWVAITTSVAFVAAVGFGEKLGVAWKWLIGAGR